MYMMNGICNQFKLKDNMVAEPEYYLGAQLSKMEENDGTGRKFWSMSSAKYCQASIIDVEEQLNREGNRLPSKCCTPLKLSYALEIDGTPELKAYGVHYYNELVGVFCWACKIGWVDIL